MIEAVLTDGKPDAEKRECFDCRFCKAAVSWWCKNKKAVERRGTAIPGAKNCEFWKGVRVMSELTWWERNFNNYIEIER